MSMIRVLLVGAAVAAGACGDDPYGSNGGGCTPTTTQVCLTASTFNPVSLTVPPGATVTWRGTSGSHTVTNDPGSGEVFNQAINGTGTFSHTFTTAGTFTYHCQFHGLPGTGMHGTIIVSP